VEHVAVVGASLAGLRAVETLRTAGHRGGITLVGAEPHPPYDRPPLSKQLLAGEWEPERITLRSPDSVDELGVEWRLGVRATDLDTEARAVSLSDGTVVRYDGLILATGTSPRRLPGQPDHPAVVVLRTLDDSLALRRQLLNGPLRVVVVGAGFIGLEIAATARQLGHRVTVLEAAPAPLLRGLGTEMGTVIGDIHGDHGVDVRCGIAIAAIAPDGVTLAGGEHVPADVVVVGIGVSPATEWLGGSGLTLRDGIVCDSTLNTGVPAVYAAGDVARWHHVGFDAELRVEHWTNAAEQGALAAENLVAEWRGGSRRSYAAVPFFWSDQYDLRIQFLGRPDGYDEVRVLAGSLGDAQFIAAYRRADDLVGVLGVNSTRALMPFRRLLLAGASWDDAVASAAARGA
jgi:NADPH-dependent 2,4-dienoyl-CoA reductase/sulfur reductase-like enzyme